MPTLDRRPPPFRLLPRVSRCDRLGWTYLRWGRRLRRIDPAFTAAERLLWGEDQAGLRIPSPAAHRSPWMQAITVVVFVPLATVLAVTVLAGLLS